jgi:hypothetical protein
LNEGEEIKVKMIERHSRVRKKDVNEEYQTEWNRKMEGERD